MSESRRVLILGAAGRDFHNFNVAYRDNPGYKIVGFTATQIPDIDGREYPASLAGELYPDGIPIYPESRLSDLIRELKVDEVVFAYSDVSHNHVMSTASVVLAAGADFSLLGPNRTMLKSRRPVVAITAVRTGAGKSPCTKRVNQILSDMGKKPVIIRHPMPYGNLEAQRWQRFASYEDLETHDCTVEEREEYEPHIEGGFVVYAGVDYQDILTRAEDEADVIIWDGGNNDLPFYHSDIHIVVADPHRAGHELTYHPGEANLRRADIVVINKIDTAPPEGVDLLRRSIDQANPGAVVIDAASPVFLDGTLPIRGRRVLVVEDGPTLTHGEMAYGAGVIAARKQGAILVDPRPFAVGSIKATYEKYSHMGTLLPAMGYGRKQLDELAATVNAADCDAVVLATPVDLSRLVKLNHPSLRVRYEMQEIGEPTLADVLAERLR